jgi:hypothetical protein
VGGKGCVCSAAVRLPGSAARLACNSAGQRSSTSRCASG